jgi:hypothetical protein
MIIKERITLPLNRGKEKVPTAGVGRMKAYRVVFTER